MSRRSILDYAGARGRLDIREVSGLSPRRFAVCEKIDGQYVHVHTDHRGRVERILSRTGSEVGRALVGDLLGIDLGTPHAVLAGELEAHTEAANREAQRRGWRNVHLFDLVRGAEGRYLAREPYRVRRDHLQRLLAAVAEPGRLSAYRDRHGILHDRKSGNFVSAPRDFRRFPVVEQRPPSAADELWQRAELGQAEGLVVVALDARLGARGSKRKVKPTTSAEMVVVAVERTVIALHWPAGGRTVHVGVRRTVPVQVGDVAEVAFEGFYADGSPRFARLVRRRGDLMTQEGRAA